MIKPIRRIPRDFSDVREVSSYLQDLTTARSSLTAANTGTVGNTYTTVVRDVIINLRTRVNELETLLKTKGLLK
jgi:hypothetical protein